MTSWTSPKTYWVMRPWNYCCLRKNGGQCATVLLCFWTGQDSRHEGEHQRSTSRGFPGVFGAWPDSCLGSCMYMCVCVYVCVCVEEPRRAKLESVTESRNQKRAFEAHSSAPPVEQERKMSSVSFWPQCESGSRRCQLLSLAAGPQRCAGQDSPYSSGC